MISNNEKKRSWNWVKDNDKEQYVPAKKHQYYKHTK